MNTARIDAETIYKSAIKASLPGETVMNALRGLDLGNGKVVVVAVGKGAWEMADSVLSVLKGRSVSGIIITKYGHSRGSLPNMEIVEAGHPVPDENTLLGTSRAVELVQGLGQDDTVLFLLSGGGSSLFELSDLPLSEIQNVNRQLLACGADIQEVNAIRKRLSRVKGGRFSLLASPARVVSLILSDVIGDRADMIASGPTCPDCSTCREAVAIAEKYCLSLSDRARRLLSEETPHNLPNSEIHICGSVRMLCSSAVQTCRELGFETRLLTESLGGTAREAGARLGRLARECARAGKKIALVEGGETVVRLTGGGLGGRNQEFALAAAGEIAGLENVYVFSVGSDGTDGPTDAAGGFADGSTRRRLEEMGISIERTLADNDSYHALQRSDGLIITGPTGTNVNDLAVALIYT